MILPINPQHASEVRHAFLSVVERERKSSGNRTSVNQEDSPVLQNKNQEKNLGRRIAVFVYGLVCYAITLGTFLYIAGFVGNLFVPKSIDSPPQAPLAIALLTNVLLLGIFAIQHSLMARPAFKQWWTQIVPKPAERSTYLLFSNLALFLMFWQWQPMGGLIWDVQDPVGRGFLLSLFAFGWVLLLVATFLINHFDLFGLRQVTLYLLGREYTRLRFRTPITTRLGKIYEQFCRILPGLECVNRNLQPVMRDLRLPHRRIAHASKLKLLVANTLQMLNRVPIMLVSRHILAFRLLRPRH